MENNITDSKSINILDFLKYLLFHWKLFLLSLVIFVGYFYYDYSRTNFVYRQTEMVMIKSPENSHSTSITRSPSYFKTVSVYNEILQLRSKELMRNTIQRTNADISYKEKIGLRFEELYTNSPVQIELDSSYTNKNFTFDVEFLDNKQLRLFNFNGDKYSKDVLTTGGKIVKTPVGNIKIITYNDSPERNLSRVIHVTKSSVESLVGYFLNNLNIVQINEEAYLLNVSLDDSSPLRAAAMLRNLILVYNEFTVEDKGLIAANTTSFIKERLAIIEQELGGVEREIQDLKTNNKGLALTDLGGGYLNDIKRYELQVDETEANLKLQQLMLDYVTKSFDENNLIPSNTGLVDEKIESIITDYNTLLLRRNRLSSGTSNSSNPVVLDLNSTLAVMQDNLVRLLKNNIQGLQIKNKSYRQEENLAKSKALKVPEQERIMLSVERQQKVKESLYIYLLNKREENALNQAMTDDNLKVIDPALGLGGPIAPSKIKKVGLGFIIGLFFPIIVLIIRLLLDTKVRNRDDIVRALSVPYLGEIPLSKNKEIYSDTVLVSAHGRDSLTEAFRILRTNINFMSVDNIPPQVISFTSAATSAGKTFNVINLVATLSYLEKSIVVVDLDLRKGTFTKRSKVKYDKGVSHFLSNKNVTIDEVIYKSSYSDKIDIVPIGMIAPNPVELLLSSRLDELINQLRGKYDYVIIDSVPLGIIADAYIIDRVTDLTIFVIRAGKLDKRQLPEIEEVHKNKKVKNMAVILNGLTKSANGYGYGYGYGYTYGYGDDIKENFFTKIKSFFKK